MTLRRLALDTLHREAGARFAPFAGWEMPLQYEGIVAEHTSVRTDAGVFDVSHMGRATVEGPAAAERIRSTTSYDVTRLAPGRGHYALYCTEQGGIADDLFAYRVEAERWLLVHNAANAATDFARLRAAVEGPGASTREITADTVMLAVQGPRAMERLAGLLGGAVRELRPRRCVEVDWRGGTVLLARTGYTGEDGAECVTDVERGAVLWEALLAAGVTPCGLGARDTLRLEAALALHGHDIDAITHPFEAGLGWVVTMDDGAPFEGRVALTRLAAEPPSRMLSCLRLEERGVLRTGQAVLDPARPGAPPIASLTSGAHGPTLGAGIGMAYLPPALAAPDTPLAIDIRGRALPARVVARPFYRRPSGA
jgi:aminomethyltransferase